MLKDLIRCAALTATVLAQTVITTAQQPSLSSAVPALLADGDPSVKPGDNFFRYANGGWFDRTEIPKDRTSYGITGIIQDRVEQRIKAILEAPPDPASKDPDAAKIHAAYEAFMDVAKINSLGATPIAADLKGIASVSTKKDLAVRMGKENESFEEGLFDLELEADLKTPDHYAIYIGFEQSGLGMPDRDFYLEPGFAVKKAAYEQYVAQLLSMIDWPDPRENAAAIVVFETSLAAAYTPRSDQRDVEKIYNPMTESEIESAASGFPWAEFLRSAGLATQHSFIVVDRAALPRVAALYAATPLAVLKAWDAFHSVNRAAPYLDSRFYAAYFAFNSHVLDGQEVERERWKRAESFVDHGMGEAIGRAYVNRYFPPSSKTQITQMIFELRIALSQRIDQLSWMTPETKTRAQTKLAKLTVKVGYPDQWRDYSALQLSSTDLVGDQKAFLSFEWNRNLELLQGPVDRSEWGYTPQTVNALYNAVRNEILFPAGILTSPYFDPAADPAVNFGEIGATIGHELTHGFDDQGRKFDGAGALTDWWTQEDAKQFQNRVSVLNAQYDSYSPFPGVHVNGAFTAGENIADLGGVLIALRAYHNSLHGEVPPVIDGLTGDQRFFLAYARSWQEKTREETVRKYLVDDPHSPEMYRVNGVVRNIDEWYSAFHVQSSDQEYVAPADRVRIW
jgi:putative endopeptidase